MEEDIDYVIKVVPRSSHGMKYATLAEDSKSDYQCDDENVLEMPKWLFFLNMDQKFMV